MKESKKNFIKILRKWKEEHWVLFASEHTKEGGKRFWCSMNGEYKVTARSEQKVFYRGEDIKEACKIWHEC